MSSYISKEHQALMELQERCRTKEAFEEAFPVAVDSEEYRQIHEEQYSEDGRGWDTNLVNKRDYDEYKKLEKRRDNARKAYQNALKHIAEQVVKKGARLMSNTSRESLSKLAFVWSRVALEHASARCTHLVNHSYSHRKSKKKTAYENRCLHRSNTLAAFDEHEEARLFGVRIAGAAPAELERWVKEADERKDQQSSLKQPEWFRGKQELRLEKLTVAFNQIVMRSL